MAIHSAVERHGDQPVACPSDSYEDLLADVMAVLDEGLSAKSNRDRTHAVAEIHAIAEDVRLRQERSSGR